MGVSVGIRNVLWRHIHLVLRDTQPSSSILGFAPQSTPSKKPKISHCRCTSFNDVLSSADLFLKEALQAPGALLCWQRIEITVFSRVLSLNEMC